MFERKTDFNKQIDQYKEDIAEMEKNRQMKEIQYQNLVQSKDSLSTEMNSIKEEKRQLNMQ
jgi:septal ring factor EnvC (AmiA/AmiB activator)